METFSALLALCTGNSPVTGEFPAQRPVRQSIDIFFDLHLNKPLSKQWWGRWFETPSWSLWRHCDAPDWCHLLGDKDADHEVCLKLNFWCTLSFQWKWQILHNYDIYPLLQQVGMFSSGIICLIKFRLLFKQEFPRVLMTWSGDTTLAHEFQTWSRWCKQRDLRWFHGQKMRFLWMLSAIAWNHFIIYSVRLFSTAASLSAWIASSCIQSSTHGRCRIVLLTPW